MSALGHGELLMNSDRGREATFRLRVRRSEVRHWVQRAPDSAAVDCERHRPEQTTPYRLVQQRKRSMNHVLEPRAVI